MKNTRPTGRFALIYYFKFELMLKLSAFLFHKTMKKNSRIYNFFRSFSKFYENQKVWRQMFKTLSIHKPSLGS